MSLKNKLLASAGTVTVIVTGITQAGASYTGTADYVGGITAMGEGGYDVFISLVNSPIGYLVMFVLGLQYLKYTKKEIGGFTPKGK